MSGAAPAPSHADSIAEALALARRAPTDTVLIAGGGIGGLASALALARAGIPSHVFERRAAFAEEGAGIQIGPNGTRILAELGVADGLAREVGVPEILRVMDGATGHELNRFPLGAWLAARHGAPYWVAHRQDLHRALASRAMQEPLVRISLGTGIVAVENDAHAVGIADAMGRAWSGRALIGADGLWSLVRPHVVAAPQPAFTGKCALRAVVPIDQAPRTLREPATTLWMSPSSHVVHYPVRAGTELAVVIILDDETAGEDWHGEVLPGWVARHTETFAPELKLLIGNIRLWRRWALNAIGLARRLSNGRIALVGDAGHPTLPFLAQGAVMALEDAMVLSDRIAARQGDVVPALRDYERMRLPRVRRIVAESSRNGKIYHLSGALAGARNLALRAAPPSRFMARYDWLYGWRHDRAT